MPKPPPPLPHALEPIADNLWAVEQHRFLYKVHFRNRMCVVRLQHGEHAGRLWIHSPVTIDDNLAKQIDALGTVAFVVSPNKSHYLFAEQVLERYPEARSYAAPGLRDKVGFDYDADLPVDGSELPWAHDIDSMFVPGVPRLRETVFFHRASRSLMCCDYMMNVCDETGWVARGAWRTLGLQWGLKQSRPWRKWFTKDARAQVPVARRVRAWSPARVVPAHGDVLDVDVDARLEQALSWLPSE